MSALFKHLPHTTRPARLLPAFLRTTLALAALTFGASGLLTGCSEEITRLELSTIPIPEGGSLPAIAAVTLADGTTTILTPSRNTLYGRTLDENRWTPVPTTRPEAFADAGNNLFDSLSRTRAAQDFPANQLFTARGNELWTIASPGFHTPPRLFLSLDAALTWTEIPLPTTLLTPPPPERSPGALPDTSADQLNTEPTRPQPTTALRDSSAAPLRLLKTANNDLFLTDSTQIWQFLPDDTAPNAPNPAEITATSWQRISLEGIDFTRQSPTTGLPAVLRNYLPATAERPFELLTVLHDQLLIYRRNQGADLWILSATLPTVDRHLLDIPGQPHVYMLTSDAVYRAEDDAQRWERIQSSGYGPQSAQNKILFALPAPTAPAAAESTAPETSAGHTLLLGNHEGSIFRSDDAGETWQETRLRDLDQREITGFAADPRQQSIWASTAGSGVLLSTDHGLTWTATNRDLRATSALTIAASSSNDLLLGTDAGLFRLTGDPRQGLWTLLHNRATSALYVHPENQRIFSGTLGGSIVVLQSNNQEHTSEAAPLGEQRSVLFQPADLENARLPAPAIVDIRPRPRSQEMFAWSHQQGPLNSNDGGASWRRLRLSSALTTALYNQIITDFATDPDQGLFVVSRSNDFAQPSQLWRSQNNGDSWHAIYFHLQNPTESPLRIERDLQQSPEVLFIIHGNHIAQSTDRGTTWSTLNGPWQNGNIAAFSLLDNTAIIVSNMLHSSEVFFIKRPELANIRPTSDITRYSLQWPPGHLPSSETTLALVTNDRHLFLSDANNVYLGTLPRQRTRLPQSVTVILTCIGLLILTAASFAFLRQR